MTLEKKTVGLPQRLPVGAFMGENAPGKVNQRQPLIHGPQRLKLPLFGNP